MAPLVNRILETALYVSDLAVSEAFYRTVFGFAELLREDRMVGLAIPERQVLLLFRRGGSVEPSPTPLGLVQGGHELVFPRPGRTFGRGRHHGSVAE